MGVSDLLQMYVDWLNIISISITPVIKCTLWIFVWLNKINLLNLKGGGGGIEPFGNHYQQLEGYEMLYMELKLQPYIILPYINSLLYEYIKTVGFHWCLFLRERFMTVLMAGRGSGVLGPMRWAWQRSVTGIYGMLGMSSKTFLW